MKRKEYTDPDKARRRVTFRELVDLIDKYVYKGWSAGPICDQVLHGHKLKERRSSVWAIAERMVAERDRTE